MNKINKNKLEHNVTLRIEKDIRENKVSGANVYVSQNGETLLNCSLGYKTVGKKEFLTEDCIFRLASMTKPIIAFAVLKLIESGKLDLFDTVDTYIKGFNNFSIGTVGGNGEIITGNKAKNEIRILNLLTHTSGLGSGAVWGEQASKMTENDKKDLCSAVEYYKSSLLEFEPYCGNSYSGIAAFDVLAIIVEIVSGKSIEEFLREELFKPLEMRDTTFFPTDRQWERVVDMHGFVNGESVAVNMGRHIFEDFPLTYTCGGAGLVSTIGDYKNFAETLLNGGEYKGKRVLSESLVRSMRIPHIFEQYAGLNETWGLGCRVVLDNNPNGLPKGCFGWSGAYGTHFWIDPVNNVVAVYMKNSFYDGGSGAITASNFEKDVMNSFQS